MTRTANTCSAQITATTTGSASTTPDYDDDHPTPDDDDEWLGLLEVLKGNPNYFFNGYANVRCDQDGMAHLSARGADRGVRHISPESDVSPRAGPREPQSRHSQEVPDTAWWVWSGGSEDTPGIHS